MLFEHLKQSTSAAHRRLEASLDWLSPDFSLDDYRRLLRRMLGFIRPWESATVRRFVGDALTLFDERRKTPALERDIGSLNDESSVSVIVATAEQLPRVDSPAKAWGSWYVVEGSTLGGQILARRFRARWNLADEAGLSYFTGYGSQTGTRWAEFRRAAEAAVDAEGYNDAATAAMDTFAMFGDWLTAAPSENGVDGESRRISRNTA